ncbi:hypothetical protein G6O69_31385 [Pseudenhygromyxa sp. WMMC2535]|uniref:HEAT repeat domain-containing protein n=1 Tax=Pseudenhygromyxa sp. WMMC2535 TaxID=2712867 RepID=UPI001555F034|nr:HEAT repeat domain-containing protein [Pseudenhygromyxa sp. WMMC2535]NVB42368.1 hypothetical protein [Pseudenhygromyxa sp. WMMC2535]
MAKIGIEERVALWVAGSSWRWLRERGERRLFVAAQRDPAVLGRRIMELGSESPKWRAVASQALLHQVLAPMTWPAAQRAPVDAWGSAREVLDEAARVWVEDAAWPAVIAALDAGGDPQGERLARAAANACSGSDRADVRAAVIARIIPRLELDAASKAMPPASAVMVMAALHFGEREAIPALRAALLGAPTIWRDRIPARLEAFGCAEAWRALASYHGRSGPGAWRAARAARSLALLRLGSEAFEGDEADPEPGVRALALEAMAHGSGPKRRRERLIAALADEDAFVRWRAIALLAGCEGEVVDAALRGVLDDGRSSSLERRAASLVLYARGDQRLADQVHGYEASVARAKARDRAAATRDWEALRELMRGGASRREKIDSVVDALIDGLLGDP